MEERSLQYAVEQKYKLGEKILAEGRFVSLNGDGLVGDCLLSLGLTDSCLVTARLDLTGLDIDYNITSMVPLQLLSFAFDSLSKKLSVTSTLGDRTTREYQLCSSANQAKIWGKFVKNITALCNVTDSCNKSSEAPNNAEHSLCQGAVEHPKELTALKKQRKPLTDTTSVEPRENKIEFKKQEKVGAKTEGEKERKSKTHKPAIVRQGKKTELKSKKKSKTSRTKPEDKGDIIKLQEQSKPNAKDTANVDREDKTEFEEQAKEMANTSSGEWLGDQIKLAVENEIKNDSFATEGQGDAPDSEKQKKTKTVRFAFEGQRDKLELENNHERSNSFEAEGQGDNEFKERNKTEADNQEFKAGFEKHKTNRSVAEAQEDPTNVQNKHTRSNSSESIGQGDKSEPETQKNTETNSSAVDGMGDQAELEKQYTRTNSFEVEALVHTNELETIRLAKRQFNVDTQRISADTAQGSRTDVNGPEIQTSKRSIWDLNVGNKDILIKTGAVTNLSEYQHVIEDHYKLAETQIDRNINVANPKVSEMGALNNVGRVMDDTPDVSNVSSYCRNGIYLDITEVNKITVEKKKKRGVFRRLGKLLSACVKKK